VSGHQPTELVGHLFSRQTAIESSRGTHLDDLVNHYEVDADALVSSTALATST
jgi:hypothetical protein